MSMRIRLSLFAILTWLCFSHAIATPIKLGDTTVELQTHQHGKGLYLVHVHHNERTALEAGITYIYKNGGMLVTLKHSGGRIVSFRQNGKTYRFDPNRIFTSIGIHRTLVKYSSYSKDAAASVKKLADAITATLPSNLIVALHNNSPNYSLNSYLPGHEFAGEAKEVYQQPGTSPHDFFFVTTAKLFNALKKAGYNVVLQHTLGATDDGSLSVYAVRHHIPYINVECAHGNLKAQLDMLNALKKL